METSKAYRYSILVNGKSAFTEINETPKVWKNVQVHTGWTFDGGLEVYVASTGSYKNLKMTSK